jgi:alkanesulfonate monooxygenase SsuD/methylene tetrahydromethanopterin reductase-like flavin-dependent oxidoreductase (luciferase family)
VKIQDLYLAGRKNEAMAAVPAELIDACHLVGPADRIKDRLQRWQEAGKQGHVSSMLIGTQQPEALQLLAENVL